MNETLHCYYRICHTIKFSQKHFYLFQDMKQNSEDSRGIAKCRNPLGRQARVSSAQARRKAELFCRISTADSILAKIALVQHI